MNFEVKALREIINGKSEFACWLLFWHTQGLERKTSEVLRSYISRSVAAFFLFLVASVFQANAQPTNDLFENRTVLTGTNILFQSSLALAGEEPGEPVPPYGYGYTGRSVWWSWTAPAKGSVALNATDAPLRIGVFTGDVLTNLVGVPQLYPGDGEDSYSLFETQPGQAYQFMFDSDIPFDPVIGSLIFTPSPSNDDFANRITLSGYTLTITTPIVGASLQPGEPPHTYWWFGSRSVWYEWTPPTSGPVVITPLSTFPMPVIDAYVGDSFTNLRQIQTGWNPQSFSVQKGVTYYLAVGEYDDIFEELPSVILQLQPTNFPSAVPRPILVITKPHQHAHLNNSSVTVIGKTKANADTAITDVLYQLNGNDWTAAASSDNWTNWTADITLTPGTNTFRAVALDANGNGSRISVLKLHMQNY